MFAEGQFELPHNASLAISWQFGHLKPTFPPQLFSAGGWNEMSQLCVLSTPCPIYPADLFVFTVWPVPKPFSRGFLHRVPLAPGSLCDWLLGPVVAGPLLPCDSHNWATCSWQSWKWRAAGEGFESDAPKRNNHPQWLTCSSTLKQNFVCSKFEWM